MHTKFDYELHMILSRLPKVLISKCEGIANPKPWQAYPSRRDYKTQFLNN